MRIISPCCSHMDIMGYSPSIDSFFFPQWLLGIFSKNIARFIEIFTSSASFMRLTSEPSLVKRLLRTHSKSGVSRQEASGSGNQFAPLSGYKPEILQPLRVLEILHLVHRS